ncbi:pyridoxal phosphate-dependent aminotransferase [Streptomyces europaeiscabiei]|uniref:pyridoxal phosphate-dependent aminotransferase n=1 Tax=Streptomyces europaeiscabiei TaxID=146819 RepID=UPI002E199EA9
MSEASSVRLNNRVYELQARDADVITLSLGEAFFDLPVPSFADLPPTRIHHYSHSRGLPLLREKLAKYYQGLSGAPTDPEREILVTAGSKAALFMTLTALIEPGDEVIIPEPLWVSYPDQVRLCRGVPVLTPWYESVEDIASYITPRTRVIIVNNPHNPSGRRLGRAELMRLHELADRHGVYLLADEAYNEFVPQPDDFVSCLAFDPDKEHTVVCNSMSKNYGISGWRIGYLIANPRLVDQILKLQQHIFTCPPTILSYYLAEHFETVLEHTRPQIQRVVELRNRLAAELLDDGVSCLPGDSTFYLFAPLGESRLGSEEFAEELLHRNKVSVVPGIGYGASCDRFVRISVGAESEERLRRGISAVRMLIEATR